MDLKALNYFIAVYEKKSISAAAKACFIAQPSVSSAIRQLEETLKNQLFTRHARGVQPTEAGLQLYPLAKQLLGQADAIKSVFVEKERIVPFRLGLIFVLFAFPAIFFVIHRNASRKINVKFFRNSFLGLVCVFLPIILHDSNGTVIGQFMIGVGIGLLKGPVSRRQLLNFVRLPENSK